MIPYHLRAKVIAAGTVANWVADYAVVGSFLSLNNAVGESGSFAIFACINAFAFMFVLICVPETKGLEIEEASRESESDPEDTPRREAPRVSAASLSVSPGPSTLAQSEASELNVQQQ